MVLPVCDVSIPLISSCWHCIQFSNSDQSEVDVFVAKVIKKKLQISKNLQANLQIFLIHKLEKYATLRP